MNESQVGLNKSYHEVRFLNLVILEIFYLINFGASSRKVKLLKQGVCVKKKLKNRIVNKTIVLISQRNRVFNLALFNVSMEENQ